jgi:hypothetical protein
MDQYSGGDMRQRQNHAAMVLTLARRDALLAVEKVLRAQAQRPQDIPFAEIKARAIGYLTAHPELVRQAALKAVEMGLINCPITMEIWNSYTERRVERHA